jgi:hypothetical protein
MLQSAAYKQILFRLPVSYVLKLCYSAIANLENGINPDILFVAAI